MDKYAVDEGMSSEHLEKTSAEGCPECGGAVERHGQVLVCKNCGSRPFEKERGKEAKK